MQDVFTACSIEIEQDVGCQASHAGGRWFDPTRAHSSLVRNSEITSPRLGSLLEPVQIRLTKSRSSDRIDLAVALVMAVGIPFTGVALLEQV
jgi:hypothetical protein